MMVYSIRFEVVHHRSFIQTTTFRKLVPYLYVVCLTLLSVTEIV
jgi:hypothetical protein